MRGRVTVASSSNAEPSPTTVSAGARRAISAAARSALLSMISKRPVEMSAQAIATLPPASPIAAHQLAVRLSSSASSVSVPAVTTRMIARLTSALEPMRLRASSGVSVWLAMGDAVAALIIRAR